MFVRKGNIVTLVPCRYILYIEVTPMMVPSDAATLIQIPTLESYVGNKPCYHIRVLVLINLVGKDFSIVLCFMFEVFVWCYLCL